MEKRLVRFNPTLVRLRALVSQDGVMGPFRFQSHAGSIEGRSNDWMPNRQ